MNGRGAALARYYDACARHHEAAEAMRTPGLDDIDESWTALPLRTRVRVILTVPWRDALTEVRHYRRART